MKFDPEELEEIGKRVKSARGDKPQSWLAERVGTKTSAISYIEAGIRPVPKNKIMLFAKVLDLDPKLLTPEPAFRVEQQLAELRDMGLGFRDLKVLPAEAKKELVAHYMELKRKYETGTLQASEDPSDLAAKILKTCGLVRPPVDLNAILEKHHIRAEASSTVASDGWIVYSKSNKWAGIKYKQGMSPGRVRFTIAHELGHYFLMKGGDVEVSCTLDGADESKEHERQANQFASHLLMPKDWVVKCIGKTLVGMSDVLKIANTFEVSRTAAAIRLTQLSNQPCAIVLSKLGKIEWGRTSSTLYARVEKGKGIPRGCQAHRLLAGKSAGAAKPTDCDKWFEGKAPGTFMEESSLIFPGTVLTLIWARNRAAKGMVLS